MIKLRVVGYSTDLDNLILTSKKQGRKGSHVTPIDDKLFDVLEDVWRLRKQRDRDEKRQTRAQVPPVESKLAPPEVQRLLRAGRTPAEVAQLAGVDVAWVERFATPVVHERTGIIADAQTQWLEKPRLGTSGAPLGEAVLQNLRSRHVRLSAEQFGEAWDATRQDSQPWIISVNFSFRGRRQRAAWRYDPHSRTLSAANRLAADLGWVKNGKKAAARLAEESSTDRRASAKARAAKKGAGKKATRAGGRSRGRAAATRAVPKRKPAKKRSPARKRAPAKRRPAARKRVPAKRKPAARKRAVPKRKPAKKRSPARKRAPAKRRPAARKRVARRGARRR